MPLAFSQIKLIIGINSMITNSDKPTLVLVRSRDCRGAAGGDGSGLGG